MVRDNIIYVAHGTCPRHRRRCRDLRQDLVFGSYECRGSKDEIQVGQVSVGQVNALSVLHIAHIPRSDRVGSEQPVTSIRHLPRLTRIDLGWRAVS